MLSWLHPPGTDFAPALAADIQIGVSSARQVGDLLDAVTRTGRTAVVTVKVDTGLNRNGVSARDFPGVLDALLARPPPARCGCGHHVPTSPAATNPTTRSMTFRRSALPR